MLESATRHHLRTDRRRKRSHPAPPTELQRLLQFAW